MKIQDIVFGFAFVLLFILKIPNWFVSAGLFCLLAAIPLFSRWIFFTGERLTWYAAAFFTVFIVFRIISGKEAV
jgi:hypothetical protein